MLDVQVGGIHMTGAAVAPIAPEPGEAFLTATAVEGGARVDHSLYHQPVTRLLALENTLNGAVMPLAQLEAAVDAARSLGLAAHLDGARLWNAAASSGISVAEYAAPFDTISVCLSKGLGAPIGSVLVGSAHHIDKARHCARACCAAAHGRPRVQATCSMFVTGVSFGRVPWVFGGGHLGTS